MMSISNNHNNNSLLAMFFGWLSPVIGSVWGLMPSPEQAVTTFILSIVGTITAYFMNLLLNKLKRKV